MKKEWFYFQCCQLLEWKRNLLFIVTSCGTNRYKRNIQLCPIYKPIEIQLEFILCNVIQNVSRKKYFEIAFVITSWQLSLLVEEFLLLNGFVQVWLEENGMGLWFFVLIISAGVSELNCSGLFSKNVNLKNSAVFVR